MTPPITERIIPAMKKKLNALDEYFLSVSINLLSLNSITIVFAPLAVLVSLLYVLAVPRVILRLYYSFIQLRSRLLVTVTVKTCVSNWTYFFLAAHTSTSPHFHSVSILVSNFFLSSFLIGRSGLATPNSSLAHPSWS